MKISIFGMGYVGCVLAAGLTSLNHNIIGVDINSEKIEVIKNGKSPVVEKDIDSYIKKGVENKRLSAITDAKEAVMNSDVSIVCVGTPCKKDGSLDLSYTKQVCEDIGKALANKTDYHIIAFKSTMFPGSVENILIPLIEKKAGKKAGKDFGICHNPEFLREGSGIYDFFNPAITVIGQLDEKSGSALEELYKDIKAPIVKTSIKIAEMIKYINNSFHGLKIAFANETGNICKKVGIDSHELMKVFFMDKQLNISSAYLMPGVPFGGSCLTKDVAALRHEAKQLGLKTAVLDSIEKSNDYHIDVCVSLIEKMGKKRIGILGLSFKEGTDDLRASAIIAMIDKLIKKGFEIKIYDQNVAVAKKFGVNKAIIEKKFPYLRGLLCNTTEEVVKGAEVIVIKNKDEEFKKIANLVREDQVVIDLVRIFKPGDIKGRYEGISW